MSVSYTPYLNASQGFVLDIISGEEAPDGYEYGAKISSDAYEISGDFTGGERGFTLYDAPSGNVVRRVSVRRLGNLTVTSVGLALRVDPTLVYGIVFDDEIPGSGCEPCAMGLNHAGAEGAFSIMEDVARAADAQSGAIAQLLAGKQDALTAGPNISIEDNVISATVPAGVTVTPTSASSLVAYSFYDPIIKVPEGGFQMLDEPTEGNRGNGYAFGSVIVSDGTHAMMSGSINPANGGGGKLRIVSQGVMGSSGQAVEPALQANCPMPGYSSATIMPLDDDWWLMLSSRRQSPLNNGHYYYYAVWGKLPRGRVFVSASKLSLRLIDVHCGIVDEGNGSSAMTQDDLDAITTDFRWVAFGSGATVARMRGYNDGASAMVVGQC